MQDNRPKALLVPIHQNSLEVQVLLAEAMKADGRLRPIMLTPDPELEKTAHSCLSEDYDIAHLESNEAEEASIKPSGSKRWSFLGLPLARLIKCFGLPGIHRIPGMETEELIQNLLLDYNRCISFLRRKKPSVVVLSDDRKYGLNMALLKAARDMGCMTILVPVALSHCRDAVPINRKHDPRFHLWSTQQKLAKAIIRKLMPSQIYYAPEGPYLFFSPTQTLALAALNMLPRDPWCPGGGDTDLVAVTGDSDLRRYVHAGVPPDKLVVTGDPNLDPMYASLLNADELRKNFADKYALDPNAPNLVCAVPQLAEHKVLPWNKHWEEIRWLVNRLMNTDYNILLSLHPKTDPSQYHWIQKEHGAVILEEPLRESLPVADVFVSGFSSTVRWASLLHIPAVVLDLYGLDHHYFDHLKGLKVVRKRDDLGPLLVRMREDHGFYEKLKAAQVKEAREIALFDGNANYNIINSIVNSMSAQGA